MTGFRIITALAVGSMLVASPLVAQTLHAAQPTLAPQNVVTLSASASTEVTKDLLQIVFSTARDGPDAAGVQSQLKQALDAALAEARRSARAGALEVQTGNFSLHPRYAPATPRGAPAGITGWQGQAELVVEGRDTEAIAQLAGRIQTLSIARAIFLLSREARERVDGEVTAQAIARFRARADAVAKLFGFGGWTLREVQVNGSDPPSFQPSMQLRASSMAQSEALPVEAGKASVSASVIGSVQLVK